MAIHTRVTPTGWLQYSDSSSASMVTPTGWSFIKSVSVQLIRTGTDISAGSWTPSTGSDLYAMLDETIPPNDTDYISVPSGSSTAEVKLTTGSDPSSSIGHTIRYRAKNNGSGSLTVYLYQGATLIATHNPTLTDYYQTYIWTISGAEADSITDYTDLRLRFTSS